MAIKHQLIIFYGSSPGAGKSTLSSFVYEQLCLHNVPARWIYEEDLLYLDAFQTFVEQIQVGDPTMIDTLLNASRRLVDEYVGGDAVLITDSIFPCFDWLFATGLYSEGQIEAFGARLEKELRPLDPLVVYLEVDPTTALARAVEQRGQTWMDDMLARMQQYGRNRGKPMQSVEDAVTYFRMAGDLGIRCLRAWQSELLVLDAAHHGTMHLSNVLLATLGLARVAPPAGPSGEQLRHWVGTYVAENADCPLDVRLKISLRDGALWVDTYWPRGCELVAESNHRYRLMDTSHRIQFEEHQSGGSRALTYDNQGGAHRYRRVPQ